MGAFTIKNQLEIKDTPVKKNVEIKDADKKNNGISDEEGKIFNACIDYFIIEQADLVNKLNASLSEDRYLEIKNNILNIAERYLKEHCNNLDLAKKLLERFKTYMFGYYILEPLLNDESISDIKVVTWDNIRVKRFGKRENSGIKFLNEEDYRRFTRTVCSRNRISINSKNAYPNFSDTVNNPLFRLRINLSDAIVNNNNQTTLHIRLEPKSKVTFDKLVKKKYMTEIQKEYLIKKWRDEGAGMLFVGPNASGKTTGVNGMIEYTPKEKNILAIQETDELFLIDHPEFISRHTIVGNNEGDIHYGLKEHSKNALMDDWDVFCLGEIKSGVDAASFPAVAATGSQVILTSHGMNEIEGLYKIGDYIKQATGYELDQCMRFLLGIKVVCYIKDYKIQSISEVRGWNYDINKLDVVKLNDECMPDDNIDKKVDKFFFKL